MLPAFGNRLPAVVAPTTATIGVRIQLLRERSAGIARQLAVAILTTAVGCTAPAAQESGVPSPTPAATITPTATASAPTASASTTPTASPTAEPSDAASPTVDAALITGFGFSDILQVEVNGLAVRRAPSVTAPLVQGYRSEDGTAQPTSDVRLNAGSFVSVDMGPLRHGGTDWYRVWPAVDARLNYNPGTWWDIDGDFATVGGVDPGWVAASVGDDQYLTLYRETNPSEYASWPPGGPTTVMVSGVGEYVSEPQVQHDLYDFDWAAAVDDALCPFSVTLVPEDGTELVAIDTSITDVEHGPTSGSSSVVETPWAASAGDPGDPVFTISIRSECAWVIKLTPLPHD